MLLFSQTDTQQDVHSSNFCTDDTWYTWMCKTVDSHWPLKPLKTVEFIQLLEIMRCRHTWNLCGINTARVLLETCLSLLRAVVAWIWRSRKLYASEQTWSKKEMHILGSIMNVTCGRCAGIHKHCYLHHFSCDLGALLAFQVTFYHNAEQVRSSVMCKCKTRLARMMKLSMWVQKPFSV